MSTGIDTSGVRRYKQGVEIRSHFDRVGTWKIWSGVDGNLALLDGHTVSLSGSTAFADTAVLPPVSYVAFSGSSSLKEQRTGGVSLSDIRFPTGWIEPLQIRRDILLLTNTQLIRHNRPRGFISSGTPVYDDRFGGSCPIVDILRPQDGVSRPYIEDRGNLSDSIRPMILGRSGGSAPFNDCLPVARWMTSVGTGRNPLIVAALAQMSGSSSDEFLPPGAVRGCGGYNFTDSIAFGDLTF